MRSFEEIQEIAAGRQGGQAALEALLPQPLTPEALGRTHDDRWLSAMTKCLFQAGFNWSAIEARWTGFEAAFDGFDPRKIALWSEEDIDRLLSDRRIVRNGAKIAAVIGIARLLVDLADKHGNAAAFFAAWPSEDIAPPSRACPADSIRRTEVFFGTTYRDGVFVKSQRDTYPDSEKIRSPPVGLPAPQTS